MPKPVYGLMVRWRDYRCKVCGHEQKVSTNHTGKCVDHCGGCSWKSAFKKGEYHFRAGTYRPFEYIGQPPTKADHNPHSGIEWSDPV